MGKIPQEEYAQGWGKISDRLKKYCYFLKGERESLCRKCDRGWGMGILFDNDAFEDGKHDHEENCSACQKKLTKILGSAPGHAPEGR